MLLALACSLLTAELRAQPHPDATVRRVRYDELFDAMSAERQRGYALTTTSNAVRFQAGVLRTLALRAQAEDPSKARLLIDPHDNARAYMAATGLRAEELPHFVRLPWRHGQYVLVDYEARRVIARAEHARPPLAISVVAWWPDAAGVAQRYAYVDTLARPTLRVTNDRVVTYRVLYFDDMVVYDEVDGISGRPLTGVLGLLFDVIGDGRVFQSRSAMSRDGLQVTRSVVKKGFITLTAIATVYPSGVIEKDIPPNRDDMDAIEKRLGRALGIEYAPALRPIALSARAAP